MDPFSVIISLAVGVIFMYTFKRITHKNVNTVSELDETKELIKNIRETIVSQLLNNHIALFSAIAKQKVILNSQQRTGIAIFISPATFKELLGNSTGYAKEQVETVYEVMRDLHPPVGFLGELPIYISELLVDAPVFVVGGISWSL